MAYTFAGRYGPEPFLDQFGNSRPTLSVTVYLRGTTTKASLYTDRTKGTPASNPFVTDTSGNGTFFADPGDAYDLFVGGLTIPVEVTPDPSEFLQTTDATVLKTSAVGVTVAPVASPTFTGTATVPRIAHGVNNLSPTPGQAFNIDASLGDVHIVTLTGNAGAATITNPVAGQRITLEFKQDATGGRTYTWPASITFSGQGTPTAVTAANARDSLELRYNGTNWVETSRAQSGTLERSTVNLFYPENYGAKGDLTTDDTTAWINCVAAAIAAGRADGSHSAEIRCLSKGYLIGGALHQGGTNKTNAQIPLTFVPTSESMFVLKIGSGRPTQSNIGVGGAADATGPAIIQSTLTGQTFDATYGVPSVIGGPTDKQMTPTTFSNIVVCLDGIVVRCPDNPSLTGVDLSHCAAAVVPSFRADTPAVDPSITVPTHPHAFGIIMPYNNNQSVNSAGQITVRGFYAGFGASELTDADKVVAYKCGVACAIQGPTYHALHIGSLVSSFCPRTLATVNPSTGIVQQSGSLPAGVTTLTIDNLDIEDDLTTWAPVYHIDDANGAYRGRINYMRVLSGTGTVATGLTLNGAANLLLHNLVPAGTDPIVLGANLWALDTGTVTRLVAGSDVQGWSFAHGSSNYLSSGLVSVPADWNTFNVTVRWNQAAGGAGNVAWQAFYKWLGAGSDTGTSNTSGTLTDGAATTNNVLVDTVITPTPLSAQAGKCLDLIVARIGGDASDTFAGAAQMIAVILTKVS